MILGKNMVHYSYTENYGTSIYNGKNYGTIEKELWYYRIQVMILLYPLME